MITRRMMLAGLLVTPAIVRARSLMRLPKPMVAPYKGRSLFDAAFVNAPYIPFNIEQTITGGRRQLSARWTFETPQELTDGDWREIEHELAHDLKIAIMEFSPK